MNIFNPNSYKYYFITTYWVLTPAARVEITFTWQQVLYIIWYYIKWHMVTMECHWKYMLDKYKINMLARNQTNLIFTKTRIVNFYWYIVYGKMWCQNAVEDNPSFNTQRFKEPTCSINHNSTPDGLCQDSNLAY